MAQKSIGLDRESPAEVLVCTLIRRFSLKGEEPDATNPVAWMAARVLV